MNWSGITPGRRMRRATDLSPSELDARLRCPDCRSNLSRVERPSGYACAGCGVRFPFDAEGRPELLPRPPARDTHAGGVSRTTGRS